LACAPPSMPTAAPRATFPTAAAQPSRPKPFTTWRSPNCPIGSRSLPAATHWPERKDRENDDATIFLADGLLARKPDRADGGRHRGALSPRASLEKDGDRG